MSAVVSIIIPCYNGATFLAETLETVLQQSFVNWECIIADNASTDNTKEICTAYANKDSRFKYIYLDKSGVSLARNTAIKNSTGKYILPLDADDKIHSDYLTLAVDLLENQSDLSLVYSDAKLFGAVNQNWELPEYSYRNLLIENCIFCTALYRRIDFEKTSGYNENMIDGFEDWDFWIKLLNKNSKVYKIAQFLFSYRIRSKSRNNSLTEDSQKKLRAQIFENNRQVYEELINADFIFEFYKIRGSLSAIKKSKALQVGKFLVDPLITFHKLIKKS